METFDIIKFNVIGPKRPVSESDILAAEKALRCKFPSDWVEEELMDKCGSRMELKAWSGAIEKSSNRTSFARDQLTSRWSFTSTI